tara:strand:+ start:1050 stop:1328 length:279 start_codon:yes stop_codon:yes gene_type:complete
MSNQFKISTARLSEIIKEEYASILAELGKAPVQEKKFPDLTGDGKVTQADILKGRGVDLDDDEEEEEEEDKEATKESVDSIRDLIRQQLESL